MNPLKHTLKENSEYRTTHNSFSNWLVVSFLKFNYLVDNSSFRIMTLSVRARRIFLRNHRNALLVLCPLISLLQYFFDLQTNLLTIILGRFATSE